MSTPASEINWDHVPADDGQDEQREKARALVHGGQTSFFPQMATAAGRELVDLARHGINLLGINGAQDEHDPNQFGTAENIARAKADNAPIFAKPGGEFGRDVANIAGTSLVAGPAEAGAAKVLSGLPRALSWLKKPLQASVGGATSAAIPADPGERGSALAEGGAAGFALGGAQAAGSRVTRGLVKEDPNLGTLRGDVERAAARAGAEPRDLRPPLSQSYDPDDVISSFIGQGYKSTLPYVPTVESQLTGQSNRAQDIVRHAMLQTAAPDGFVVHPSATKDMQLTADQIQSEYDSIHNGLRQITNITTPKGFSDQLTAKIRASDPQLPPADVEDYVSKIKAELDNQASASPGKSKINGWNLKNVSDYVADLHPSLSDSQKGMTGVTKDYIDDIFAKKYQQAFGMGDQKSMDILTKYITNRPNYEDQWRPLKAVIDANKGTGRGTFPISDPGKEGVPFTPLEGIGQDANAIFSKPAAKTSQQGRLVGYGAVSAANLLAHGTFALPTALIAGTGRILGTESTQKALSGNAPLQRSLKKFIENHPNTAGSLAFLGRTGVTSNLENDDANP